MRIAKKVLAAVAILGMALTGAAIGEPAASASTVPVVYNDNGWHGSVKPGILYFGNGGAPYITGLHWTSWNATSAQATGRLWTEKFGCTPSYRCGYSSRYVQVDLNTVRSHDGTGYYARMTVRFRYGGKWRRDTGWIRNGFWVFPVTFPYL